MSAHTPGPWDWDGVRVFAPALDEKVPVTMADGTTAMHGMGLIALPYACRPVGAWEGCGSHDANSRLIAAAPDLLAAAKAIVDSDIYSPGCAQTRAAFDLLDAAIAKAEGVQP